MADPTIKDLAYRGLAAALGGPVDLATMVMRPFGYNVPEQQVVGGSEWIGKKLEDVGLVSSARAPVQEFITSMAIPTPSGLAKGAALGGAALVGAVKSGGKTMDALNKTTKEAKNLMDETSSLLNRKHLNLEYRSPRAIEPPHEVRDPQKLEKIKESMVSAGFEGRPILAFDIGRGAEALTGSHRIRAARQAGLDKIPVVMISDDIANYTDEAGRTIQDAAYMEADELADWLRKFGDDDAADLMALEHLYQSQ